MYTSQIITAEIKSQKGFFVGDPCYALTRSMYETLWGKMNNYRDCLLYTSDAADE